MILQIPLSSGGFEGAGPFMQTGSLIAGSGSDQAIGIGGVFSRLASTIFGFLTILAGVAFLLYFVLGAISWITSGGDAQKVETAKNQMTSAAIGLIAVIAAYAVAGIVSLVLGIDILNPTGLLQTIAPGP